MKLIEFKLQPSDIGNVIPLSQNIELEMNDNTGTHTIRTESINIIDPFVFGYYDDCEVISMGATSDGYFKIVLNKMADQG